MFLVLFTVVSGAIISFLLYIIFRKHIKKNGTIKEKSFTLNAPKLFGTINIILALAFGLWYLINPSVFSQNEQVTNKLVLVFLHIFFTYFYVLALPLSIGSTVLALFLKKHISRPRFLYYIIANVAASTIIFPLIYFILN